MLCLFSLWVLRIFYTNMLTGSCFVLFSHYLLPDNHVLFLLVFFLSLFLSLANATRYLDKELCVIPKGL